MTQEQASLLGVAFFMSQGGTTHCEVPFSREAVEKQAKLYASRGFSLMDSRGRHWIWDECFDALMKTALKTITVVLPVGPSKRRHRGGRVVALGNVELNTELTHK